MTKGKGLKERSPYWISRINGIVFIFQLSRPVERSPDAILELFHRDTFKINNDIDGVEKGVQKINVADKISSLWE